jgi:hypothetical protein
LSKCEADPAPDVKTTNIYLKGRLFYDSVEDNPEYDYTWGFVKVEGVN